MSITLVQKNKSKGIMTWYARVPDPHKKSIIHFFSLGTTSKSEAKLIMQQRIKEGAYDIKDEAKKKVPSWRRICKVLLKNDYWCKGLSFSQTKKELEKQVAMITRYNEEL